MFPKSNDLERLEKNADAVQEGGNHYKSMDVQPWTAMQAWLSADEFRGFLQGNAIKYLARAGHKGNRVDDLKKARHYIDKLIEIEEAGS